MVRAILPQADGSLSQCHRADQGADTQPAKPLKRISMKKNFLSFLFLLTTSVAFADTGVSGIGDAADGVVTYMPYVRALCYVIAAVIAEGKIVYGNQRHNKKTPQSEERAKHPNGKQNRTAGAAAGTCRTTWELRCASFHLQSYGLNKFTLAYCAARCQAQGSAILPGAERRGNDSTRK